MTTLNQAISEAADTLVDTLTTPDSNLQAANDALWAALDCANGLVELDGKQYVKRAVLIEIQSAIIERAARRLGPDGARILWDGLAALLDQFPMRH
jgi:hypothetical protein